MKAWKTLTVLVLAGILGIQSAQASALTRPQILKELQNLEGCLRLMCIPAHNPTMSISGSQALITKLSVNPNALDRWTIQRLNAEVLLLKQQKLQEGLTQLQTTIKTLPAQ